MIVVPSKKIARAVCIFFVSSLLNIGDSASATLNFNDIDGGEGNATLVPADVWNNGSKTIIGFGGIRGLSATVTSTSTPFELSDRVYGDAFAQTPSGDFIIRSENDGTGLSGNVTFSFNIPISGSIEKLTYFGDTNTPEIVIITVGGAGAVVTDRSGQSSTTGASLTFSSANASGSFEITPLLSYSNISSITFTYSCVNTQQCGSFFEDWVIDEALLTFSSTDPTKKADVVGSLLSKELIAYHFYKGAIQSVNNRLSWLAANRTNSKKSKQGIKFNFSDNVLNEWFYGSSPDLSNYQESDFALAATRLGQSPNQYNQTLKTEGQAIGIASLKAKIGVINLNPQLESIGNDWNFWTDGEVSVGKSEKSLIASSRDFNRAQLTLGFDKQHSQNTLIGFAFSNAKEDVDVGTKGSNIKAKNVGLVVYAANSGEAKLYQIETSLGYGSLQFDTKRVDDDETLTGKRKGNVYFGSFGVRSIGNVKGEKVSYSSYGRLNIGHITFINYSEVGGSTALTHFEQNIDYEELMSGFETSKTIIWKSYSIRPHMNIEYSYFFNKSSPASMRYFSSANIYSLSVPTEMKSGWKVAVGADLWSENGLSSNISISTIKANNNNQHNAINLGISSQF